MAPNVKQLALLSLELENLDIVQTKFLPLTHPEEEQEHKETKKQEEVVTTSDSSSYWDWPSEDPKDFFSASNIEANLIEDAKKVSEKSTVASQSVENYWEEKVEEHLEEEVDDASVEEKFIEVLEESLIDENDVDVEHSLNAVNNPQHQTSYYWDWPADNVDSRELMIASILQEEFIRKQVSADEIQKNLVLETINKTRNEQTVIEATEEDPVRDSYWSWDSPVVRSTAAAVLDTSHPQYSYWEWTSNGDENKARDEKLRMIEMIVEEERLRNLLSVQHLELAERSAAKEVTPCRRSNVDEYWTFSEENENDHYWDWGDSLESATSYWVL